MNYVILTVMICIILSGIFFERSRFVSYAIMTVFFILICFSYDAKDYHTYIKIYNNINAYIGRYEPLFLALMRVGNLCNLNYDQFRMIITAIELIVIHSTIRRFSDRTALVWSLFVIFPGWTMTLLLRHMMAFTVIVYGMRYIFDDSRTSTYKLLVIIVIAALFHNSFWIFLSLIPMKLLSSKTVFWIYIVAVLFTYFMGVSNFWFKFFELLPISIGYIEKYMINSYSNLNGIIYNILRQIVIVYSGYLSVKLYKRKINHGMTVNKIQADFMENVLKINISSIVYLCVLYYVIQANRMYHPIVLINIIAWSITTGLYGRNMLRRILGKMTMVGTMILLSVLFCTKESAGAFDLILKMHFETNDFINLFG